MLTVLKIEFQKKRSVRTSPKFARPTKAPLAPQQIPVVQRDDERVQQREEADEPEQHEERRDVEVHGTRPSSRLKRWRNFFRAGGWSACWLSRGRWPLDGGGHRVSDSDAGVQVSEWVPEKELIGDPGWGSGGCCLRTTRRARSAG